MQSEGVTAELFVEVLGCLANLYLPEFDFFALVRKHDLLKFLASFAQPGMGKQKSSLQVTLVIACAHSKYIHVVSYTVDPPCVCAITTSTTYCTTSMPQRECCVCIRAVDDDILLEVVMFVGVLCNEGTAPMLVESGLVSHNHRVYEYGLHIS